MKPVIFTAIIAISPLCAQAQTPDCAEPMTQSAMNICASQSFAQADSLLNQVWKRAVGAARERDAYLQAGEIPSEDMLRDAQRTWITFRDQACLAESTLVRGGSLQPLFQYTCLEEKTLSRIADLEYFASTQ